MKLIDVHGSLGEVGFRSALEPLGVVPLIAFDVVNQRGVVGTLFGIERVRIGFQDFFEPRGLNTVLIQLKLTDSLDEKLPDTVVVAVFHVVAVFVPVVKIADNGYAHGVRSPNPEQHALFVFPHCFVRAEVFIRAQIFAVVEKLCGSAVIVRAVIHTFNSIQINIAR